MRKKQKDLSSLDGIQREFERVYKATLAGSIQPSVCNALVALLNAARGVVNDRELTQRVENIEKALAEDE